MDDAAIRKRIERWKTQLLDLSLRNRLLNFRDGPKTLQLSGCDPGLIENALASRKGLRLVSAGPEAESGRAVSSAVVQRELAAGRVMVSGEDAGLVKKLKAMAKDSKLAQEEMGVDTLHLALGMLAYYESGTSNQRRVAPLLLVPVSLSSKKVESVFELCASGEDTLFNVTLLEKLRREHGIQIPELMDDLPLDDAGVDVLKIMDLVRQAVATLDRAEVLLEVHLAHFSFTKFLMWRDLERHSDRLLAAPLVRELAGGHIEHSGGPMPNVDHLDDDYAPETLQCIYDADSSQMVALAAAAAGRSFVLQGPPGTGKSQTITNLIAHCMHQGKSILFVAEKRAALEVVQNRLEQAGLGEFCLDLHSHKAGSAAVLQQLQRAMRMERPTADGAWTTAAAQVTQLREQLNKHVRELHRPRDHSFSPFDAIAAFVATRGTPTAALRFKAGVDRSGLAELEQTVEQLVSRLAEVGPLADHPLASCQVREWRPELETAVHDAGERLVSHVAALQHQAALLASQIEVTLPNSLSGMEALVDLSRHLGGCRSLGGPLARGEASALSTLEALLPLASRRATERAHLSARYSLEGMVGVDVSETVRKLERWSVAFFLFAWIALWGVRKQLAPICTLPRLPAPGPLLDDLRRALTLSANDAALKAHADSASGLLGLDADSRLLDADDLLATQKDAHLLHEMLERLGTRWRSDQGFVGAMASPDWPSLRSEIGRRSAGLADQLRGFKTAREDLARLFAMDGSFAWPGADTAGGLVETCAVATRLQSMAGVKLRSWAQLQSCLERLRQEGLEDLFEQYRRGKIVAEQLRAALVRAYHTSWLQRDETGRHLTSDFRGTEHSDRIERFVRADKQLVLATRNTVRTQLATALPSGDPSPGSEVGVIAHELKKKRGHMPIRKLLAHAPNAVRRIKPCVMMSPLSVTQYLDIRAAPFDLVVFDEASQVPVHDAIGALARAKQIIVVGDSKQLPPTNFFSKQLNEEPDDDVGSGDDGIERYDGPVALADAESILEEFEAANLVTLPLRWHYRSQHESLIAFSNHFYYENGLLTVPSATESRARLGVSLRRVDGVYDSGKSRTNRIEAEALVAELVQRLQDPENAARTYGVVTFSQAQQVLVETLLEDARCRFPEIEPFFSSEAREGLFVKNLENVQGDERDVIFFTICYGLDHTGKLKGLGSSPLNKEGGHRRLNVAITRAREQLLVFSSIGSESIDESKAKHRGVREVKIFLDYAQRGMPALHSATTTHEAARLESPFEAQVYAKLCDMGYDVRTQIGCAGYRIDLGIVDPRQPGRYLLGVECDGASYHSSKSARDRDRLRGMLLEKLGWALHRIWSTDWWIDPAREAERIRQRVEQLLATTPAACAAALPVQAPAAVNASHRESLPALSVVGLLPAELSANTHAKARDGIPYKVCVLPVRGGAPDAFYEGSSEAKIASDVKKVVEVESPVSVGIITRRVLPAWDLKRATPRATSRLQTILERLARDGAVRLADGIVWCGGHGVLQPEEFRPLNEDDGRALDDVALEELACAARAVLQRDISLPRKDLASETARMMGLSRVRSAAAARCDRALNLVISGGHGATDGTQVALVRSG